MHIHLLFLQYAELYPLIAYSILFLGMLVEGEVLFFIFIFLAYQQILNLPLVVFVTLIGTFGGDVLWYAIGYYVGDRWKWVERLTSRFDERIMKTPLTIFLITKFTYGIQHAVQARAGMLRLPLKKYIKTVIPPSIAWVVVMVGIGIIFSSSLHLLQHYLKYVEGALLIGLVGFIFLEFFIDRYVGKRFVSEKKDETC